MMKRRQAYLSVLIVGEVYLVSLVLLGCAATGAVIPKDHPMASEMRMIYEVMQNQFVKGYNIRDESLYMSAFLDFARVAANDLYRGTFDGLQKGGFSRTSRDVFPPMGLPTLTVLQTSFQDVKSNEASLITQVTIHQPILTPAGQGRVFLEGPCESQWVKVDGKWYMRRFNCKIKGI
ncbi:MAG: hypothetical protein HY731_13845 [Candidatus Tectomicrobia bacterium]|nr:hypothetical protein [Candidatus Tectomicrobia bacterium]